MIRTRLILRFVENSPLLVPSFLSDGVFKSAVEERRRFLESLAGSGDKRSPLRSLLTMVVTGVENQRRVDWTADFLSVILLGVVVYTQAIPVASGVSSSNA